VCCIKIHKNLIYNKNLFILLIISWKIESEFQRRFIVKKRENKIDQNQTETPPLKRGLTPVSILALILAAVLFLPTSLYLNLVAGTQLAGAAVYVIAIVFASLGTFFRREVTKQELFIIYAVVGGVASFIPPYYWFVCRSYFMTSPLSYKFKINGVPLPELVPFWMAPPPNSPAHFQRALISSPWLPAILVYTTITIMGYIANISLACIFSHFFISLEKLRFPFAEVDSTLVTTLSEKPPERIGYFLSSLTAGSIIGALIYLPQILGMPLVPLPWVDLSMYTQKYLPGAIIGLATTPSTLIFGFMLPIHVTASMLIGSAACWIFGNTIFITIFPEAFPEWSKGYFEGMNIAFTYQRSYLWLWISFQFGAVFGVMIFLIFRLRKSLFKMIKEMIRPSTKADRIEIYPLRTLMLIYLTSAGGTVVIHHLLIPDYPIWASLTMSLGLSFVITFVASLSVGELGIAPTAGDAWSLATWVSGYEGYPGWFFKPFLGMGEAAGMVQRTKAAYLTETKPTDFYKALIIGYVLALVMGLISMDIFWRMAPIPSAAYPNTLIYWPTTLMSINLWATRKIQINPELLISGTIIFAILGFVGMGMERLGVPFSLISVATGTTQLPPVAIMIFIGSILGKYVIARIIGKDKWLKIRGIIVAGFVAGVSLSSGISIAISLLMKATWIWPW